MKYSLVIPVFNNSKGIQDLYLSINSAFSNEEIELIFVDDCSADDSWNELKSLKAKDARVKIIRLAKNFGQHAATLCGFEFATGDFVLTMDDDLEVLPIQFKALIKHQAETGAHVV